MQTTKGRENRRSYGFSKNRNQFGTRTGTKGKYSGNAGYHGGRRPNQRQGGNKRRLPTFNPSQFINTHPSDNAVEVYNPKHKFTDFGLNPKLMAVVTQTGLVTPTPIQDQIIPKILDGKDVVGIAETGTGKTAAFLLPLIEKTFKNYKRQTLVLTPTRELAIQIEQELKKLSKGLGIFSTVCVGGANIRPQINGLRKRNHFIIGTPGRIMDLVERGHFNPHFVTTVVLDEADRMLDMGFIDPIRTILGMVPVNRETLFFSATMDEKTKVLVGNFLKNPIIVSVKKRDVTSSIKQDIVRYGHENKFETLMKLLSQQQKYSRVIVFGSMKHSVERLSNQLASLGVDVEAIHGNKSHSQRQRALSNFKSGKVQVLVATDVAARGIHVDDVSHVINYDLPNTFEDYVHRIGRTGRGDKVGEALTFVSA